MFFRKTDIEYPKVEVSCLKSGYSWPFPREKSLFFQVGAFLIMTKIIGTLWLEKTFGVLVQPPCSKQHQTGEVSQGLVMVFSVSSRTETSQASSLGKLFHCSMTLTITIHNILLTLKKKVFQFVSIVPQKHKLFFFSLSEKLWQMNPTFTEVIHKDP